MDGDDGLKQFSVVFWRPFDRWESLDHLCAVAEVIRISLEVA